MADADLYAVLGLKRECSDADLRLAYRRLAMTWHPDRCSASGSSARVQGCQQAVFIGDGLRNAAKGQSSGVRPRPFRVKLQGK
ncbi:dnaJ protein homolog 1-like [Triticum urartu]|nr:dnaJ protein homolog 1-like [Triticum urartu]